MTAIQLNGLRNALEGVFAAVLSTCDSEGTPNVSMISQVHYVDPEHVALSYQFFNKTRANLLATRRATVQVTDPDTCAHYRLYLAYENTLTNGPVFEGMKAKLAGIASHHGMESVFRLLGSDIFRVEQIEAVPGPTRPVDPVRPSLLAATRRTFTDLASCTDLDDLLDCVTTCLKRDFDISYSMVLIGGGEEGRLYTVASHGYATTGVGAEVMPGEGVIGVAARENAPIRIGHMTRDYRYGAAISDATLKQGLLYDQPRRIPFPGLAAPRSQIALPISDGCGVLGVLFAESHEIMRFGYEHEDALALVAGHLGTRMALLRHEVAEGDIAKAPESLSLDGAVTFRHFAADQSIFLDNDYLIKGVAGAILWRLLRENRDTGRTEFSTRELRLDPALRLPTNAENLDARLILLRKRLEERCACVRIEKAGRGRFRLIAACRIQLEDIDDSAA